MKILDCRESAERCAEAGWFAYDLLLERKADREFIMCLRPLGAWTFLTMLKKPFYKVEADHMFLKGILEEPTIRVAVSGDHPEELEAVRAFIESMEC